MTTTAISSATTKPSEASEKEDEQQIDAFKVDWRDTLRGVKMDMLWNALVDALEHVGGRRRRPPR